MYVFVILTNSVLLKIYFKYQNFLEKIVVLNVAFFLILNRFFPYT